MSGVPGMDAQHAGLEVVFAAELPVPPERAFAFVSDPRHWPLFFESMRSAEVDEDWGRPGAGGRLVTRFLGRDVVSDLELLDWDPPREFRFVARQHGRPDLDNRRAIHPSGTGARLVGATRMRPRPGLVGVLDRTQLWILKRRVFDPAMAALPAVVGGHTASDG